MWHEARRRERATQKLFSDHKKRAEKRREENRVDPSSLLQVHGVKSKVNIDPTTHKLAANSMVVWQGDQKTTIDRFDVRATLSSLPTEDKPFNKQAEKNELEKRRKPTVLDANENEYMKKLLNYERYRLVMQNDLNKLPETTRLSLVNKKNDLLSEAQMRKLKNNWFGTSGETSVSGDHGASNNRNLSTRHQGVSIGFDYNMTQNEIDDDLPMQMNVTNATTIPDLDDCDAELDLDCVDKSQLDPKYINEVLNRYGLNCDDFNVLVDSTSRNSKEIINKLKRVKNEGKRLCEAVRLPEVAKQQGFYGPALPPEMEKREKNSPSSHSSGNASPIRRPSPASAEALIRTQDKNLSQEISSGSSIDQGLALQPHKSNQTIDTSDSKHNSPRQSENLDESSQNNQSSYTSLSTNSSVTQNSQQLTMTSESRTALTTRPGLIQINLRSGRSIDENNSEPMDTPDGAAPRARRAVTPLAYKRYCRSSRSLSRERIASHRHRSSDSSSSFCTSRSTTSSSSSTNSSYDRRFHSGSRRKRKRSRSSRDRHSRHSRHRHHRRERR